MTLHPDELPNNHHRHHLRHPSDLPHDVSYYHAGGLQSRSRGCSYGDSSNGNTVEVGGALALMIIICGLTFIFVGIFQYMIRVVKWLQRRGDNGSSNNDRSNNNNGPEQLTSNTAELFDNSSLALRAGLAPGLLLSEREEILRYYFRLKLCSYVDLMEQNNYSRDSNNQMEAVSNEPGKEKNTDDEGGDDVVHAERACLSDQLDAKRPPGSGCDPSGGGGGAAAAVCCICLAEYDPAVRSCSGKGGDDEEEGSANSGLLLIQGTQCRHVFHYSCCMEWLKKQHNDCPCCRAEMLSPQEFRLAAIQTLGEARVRQLQKNAEP